MTTNSPVPGTVESAPSSHNFEPGATPHTLAKDVGLAAKAMAIAHYHCQLATQAGELYRKMAESGFADQDFSGIIIHGPMSDAQRSALTRAVGACPIHKLMTSTKIEIDAIA